MPFPTEEDKERERQEREFRATFPSEQAYRAWYQRRHQEDRDSQRKTAESALAKITAAKLTDREERLAGDPSRRLREVISQNKAGTPQSPSSSTAVS